jgi:hypothetical protein
MLRKSAPHMVNRDLFPSSAQDQFALAPQLGFALATLRQCLGAAPARLRVLDGPSAN